MFKRVLVSSVVFLLVCGADAQAASTDKAAALGLLPHKALYDVRLATKKSSAQVAGIHGQMAYEWQPDCDAWISNTQFDMTYEYLETPRLRVTSDFSTYESIDGKRMNYTAQRMRDNSDVFEEFRGEAVIDPNIGKSRALYSIPEGLEKDLPEGTLFPIAHTLGVIEAINAGQKFYTATIFDGSDEEGAALVNTFIGKPADVTPYVRKDKQDYDNALLGKKAWNLRLAFFPLDNEEETTADYEMNVVFHETGVISHMVVEYSDFSVVQSLVTLEPMSSICGSESKIKEKEKDKNDNPE